MLNFGMTINAVAMDIGCSTRAIRHLRQRFQATWPFGTPPPIVELTEVIRMQQGIRKIDHVVNVRASRREAKTTLFGTPIWKALTVLYALNSFCCVKTGIYQAKFSIY